MMGTIVAAMAMALNDDTERQKASKKADCENDVVIKNLKSESPLEIERPNLVGALLQSLS